MSNITYAGNPPSPRIAMIGCGTVTGNFYLPAVRRIRGARVTALIDLDVTAAELLARRFRIPRAIDDYAKVFDYFEAAIIAVPNHLHAPIALDLIEHGKHVLVDKPMALTAAEVDGLITAAKRRQVVLAAGQVRRFHYGAQWVKEALAAGAIGKVTSFDFRVGWEVAWEIAGMFYFDRRYGGGVLYDAGAHALDILLWWLGDVASVTCRSDDYGGVEADCELELRMTSGATGTVELSRSRTLRNTAILRGETGEIEVPIHRNDVRTTPDSLRSRRYGRYSANRFPKQARPDLFVAEIRDFIEAIAFGWQPLAQAADVRRSIALIERCKQESTLWELPWVSPRSAGE